VYFSVVSVAALYLIASVSVWLLHRHRARYHRPPIGNQPRLQEMLACHKEVDRLFDDLNRRYAEVPAELGQASFDVTRRARELQAEWRHRWRETGQHCRFAELAGKGMGPGFDQLATVYSDLEEVDIGYAALLGRFGRQLASRVDDMRRTLQASRRSLEEAARRAHPAPAASRGAAGPSGPSTAPASSTTPQTRPAGAPPAPPQ